MQKQTKRKTESKMPKEKKDLSVWLLFALFDHMLKHMTVGVA